VAVADTQTGWSADEAITRLFAVHYVPLTRLATLLTSDPANAEEIVADSFVALHMRWHKLGDADRAVAYLRATVVNRSRSALRHRRVVERHVAASDHGAQAPSAETGALERLTSAAILAAVSALPTRQREALVLRYYGDLSEAAIAEAMGCSRGSVKSHLSRGMAALRRSQDMAALGRGAEQWS
jgi:RNA polymerase sigma-70 factor (sigma-E family)